MPGHGYDHMASEAEAPARHVARHPLSQKFHDLLREIGDLHDRKQADYGRDDDPFANVTGSKEWGIRPWVGAMLRANDKIKRLQKYATTGQLANEGARDSFLDLAVYALIGLVLWELEQNLARGGQPDASTEVRKLREYVIAEAAQAARVPFRA